MSEFYRLVLEGSPSEQTRRSFLRRMSLALKATIDTSVAWGKPERSENEYAKKLRWYSSKGEDLELELTDDGFLDLRFLTLQVWKANSEKRTLSILREHLPVIESAQLLEIYRAAPNPRNLGAYLLGGASKATPQELEVARTALRSGDDSLVESVAYAQRTLYWHDLHADIVAAWKAHAPGETKRWLKKSIGG